MQHKSVHDSAFLLVIFAFIFSVGWFCNEGNFVTEGLGGAFLISMTLGPGDKIQTGLIENIGLYSEVKGVSIRICFQGENI